MEYDISFTDGELLIERLISATEQDEKIVVLVGSPITAPAPGGTEPGVPGVAGILEQLRTRVAHRPELLRRYEERLAGVKHAAEQYQRATQFMVEAKGQPELNLVIREAVLKACTAQGKLSAGERNLEQVEDNPTAWHLRPGVAALGSLLVEFPATFISPILTTNFDPLIEVGIKKAGGSAQSVFLSSDGRFDNVRGGSVHRVVHLHGHWLRDSLHTPLQLTRPRPQLKGSIRDLLASATLLVIAYGGWNDVFTKALREVIREGGDQMNVIWSFFERDDASILAENGELINELAPAVGQRVVFYKGVNCHKFFPALLSALRNASSGRDPSPLPVQEHSSEVTANGSVQFSADEDFIGAPPERAEVAKRLSVVPRWRHRAEPHHRRIRLAEQEQLKSALQRKRGAWIAADWGLAKDAFLATVIEDVENVFRLNLNGVEFENLLPAFLAEVSSVFKMSLEQVVAYLARLGPAAIIVDNLPYSNASLVFDAFEEKIQAVLDFAQELRVILVSRRSPAKATFPLIKLSPLDEADASTYVAEHPDGGAELARPRNIETLFRRSEGVPMYLDKLLRDLKYLSIEDLDDAEPVANEPAATTALEPIPVTLQQATAELARQSDRDSQRSYRMLKILSVLPVGETFQNIRRFYPTEPFYPDHVDRLESLGLLETMPVVSVGNRLVDDRAEALGEKAAPKLLVVPRPVRDYMRTAMTDDEKLEIAYTAAALMFGEKWRDGKFKFSHLVTDSVERGAGQSNPHTVICQLTKDALQKRQRVTVRRVVRIAEAYLDFLDDGDRYREMANFAQDMLRILCAGDGNSDTARISAYAGYGLRMIGDYEAAIAACKDALDRANPDLGSNWRAGVWLDLAYAHRHRGEIDATSDAANQVLTGC